MISILAATAAATQERALLPSLRALRGGAVPPESPPTLLRALRTGGSDVVAASSASSELSEWWGEHRTLVLAIAGSLALVAPALRTLPRTAAITAAILVVTLVQMAFDLPPDLVLLEAVVALVGLNVLNMKEALDGFRSEGVVTVAVMCAVAKSVQATGGLQLITKYLLGSPSGYESGLLRMLLAVMAISAFMNNTPVCAMMMPLLNSYAASLGVSSSAFLMPLSFATMLGGTLTMIGSSTNLVAANAAHKHDPTFNMKVFDISGIGAINGLAGVAYMVLFGRKLLPATFPTGPPPAKQGGASSGSVPAPRGAVRLWLTLGLITATMTVAAQEPKALLPVALGVLCIFVRVGCLSLKEAWSAVNGPVLLSIALSFALGEAIKKSELAAIVANKIVALVAPYGQLALLFAIYFVAILVGAVISNNAVVALMFPVVVRICDGAGIDWKPALYTLTLAASASFSTPVSYQTNLMVASEANYSFGDFLKFGLPLQLVCMLATVPACLWLAK
jgi:di/tricarboxylate transporter